MNVLVIGKPRYNTILSLDGYPLEGSKINAADKLDVPGGISVYVACMLAKWGIKVYYSGLVCADEIGNKIKAELEKYNVDIRFMEVNYENKSGNNYVLINKTTGISTEILKDNEVFLSRYKYDIIPDIIITDGTDMGASVAASNNYPKAKMILIANKVNDDYYNLSKRCHYVCANMAYASALTKMDFDFKKTNTLVDLFQKIKDLNKAEYIIMLKEHGVLYTAERQVKLIPAINVEVVDDSNSGSAFFGAYAYGIIKNYDADTVAKTANIAGALALTKTGSLLTIPEKEEVYNMAGIKEEANENLSSTETLSNEKLPALANDNITETLEGTTDENAR